MNEFGVWQPIETAPRDGTEVLLSGWYKAATGEKFQWIDVGMFVDEDWYDNPNTDEGWMFSNVTHWMPLPEPPAL